MATPRRRRQPRRASPPHPRASRVRRRVSSSAARRRRSGAGPPCAIHALRGRELKQPVHEPADHGVGRAAGRPPPARAHLLERCRSPASRAGAAASGAAANRYRRRDRCRPRGSPIAGCAGWRSRRAAAGRARIEGAARRPLHATSDSSGKATPRARTASLSDSGSTSARLPRPGASTPDFSADGEIQPVAGAGERDVEQPPRLVLLALAIRFVHIRHERPDRHGRLVVAVGDHADRAWAGRWRPWPC